MSTFKFNFPVNSESNDKEICKAKQIYDTEIKKEENFEIAYEVYPDDKIIAEIDDIVVQANIFVCDDLEIGYVKYEDAFMQIKDGNESNNLLLADKLHSDLVEGKYEGGLKVWECTSDLIEYIVKNSIDFKASTVLDLGCGMGLIGISTLLNGATVHFQDYNTEVLNSATIHNVLLNLPDNEKIDIKTRCRFFAGDWEKFDELMNDSNCQYDYILTSETIYNPKNYNKVYKLIKNRLKKNGCALIAAKSHYFGIGGNTREFEKCVKDDNTMNCEVCWKSDGGLSREIIKLTFKL